MTSTVGRSASRPKVGAGLGAQRGPVEGGDHPADRQADVARVAQRGVGEARRDVPGEPDAELVGDARQRVALVHDQRQPAAPGGEVGRHRDVAAEPDDHVGADPVDHLERGLDRAAQPGRDPGRSALGRRGSRHRRDQLERVARLGDDPGLQAARGAQRGHLDARLETAQRVGGGEQRGGVPRGAPAGEKYLHESLSCSIGRGRCAASVTSTVSAPIICPRRAGPPPAVTPAGVRRRRRARNAALRPGLGAGERHQQTERDQRGQQRRPTVGHQRERDADHRQQGEHHADVDHHLHGEPDRDAGRHVAHERVLGAQRDPDPGVGDGQEEREHQQGADQAELLAEHGEDEVGVGLGQGAPLLLAGRDALAEDAAARHREQPVRRLPAGALVVLERVGEVGQPLQPLRRWWWPARAPARRRCTGRARTAAPGRRPPRASRARSRTAPARCRGPSAPRPGPRPARRPGPSGSGCAASRRAASPCGRRGRRTTGSRASLASSEGWSRSGPSESQFWLPLAS